MTKLTPCRLQSQTQITQLSQLEKKEAFSKSQVTTNHLKMHITVIFIAQKNSNKSSMPLQTTARTWSAGNQIY